MASGPSSERPNKPWVSDHTWQMLKWIVPLRRVSYLACCVARCNSVRLAWLAWRSCLHADFDANLVYATLHVGCKGWLARARFSEVANHRRTCWRINASYWSACRRLQRCLRPLLWLDKQIYIEDRAHEAEVAARRGDSRAAFAIVRALGGSGASRTRAPVKQKNGELTTGEIERQERWLEHFADTFGGLVVNAAD